MKKMLDETSRILQLNGLINEIRDPDDIEIDLVIENDDYEIDLVIENDMINEKTPNQKKSLRTPINPGKYGRYNTVYGNTDPLPDREKAPKKIDDKDLGYKWRARGHAARLKNSIKRNLSNIKDGSNKYGVVTKRDTRDKHSIGDDNPTFIDYHGKNGFKKLGKKNS